jgi:hypothetical protein
MIAAIGISQRDFQLALKWLKWVAALHKREPMPCPLVAFGVRSLSPEQFAQLRNAASDAPIQWAWCQDEDESGYPKSASHLFLRTLTYCEERYPGEPVLWVEADAIPMRPSWLAEIAKEYAECGRPFLGVIVRGHGHDHLSGCSVYPPDWRAKAPMLAAVLGAPDIFWGPGLGQAFDSWAAPEIVPQAAEAKTIQQIWRPLLPLTERWRRKNIPDETALFHQCKDGSLIKILQEQL